MFNSKEELKSADQLSTISNTIAKGTVLEGSLETAGNIRIEGTVIGNITTEAKIVLGQPSKISGDVVARNAEVEGELKGNIRISDTLILKPTSLIHGDIITNKLIVESGATFNGACRMGVTTANLKPNETRRPQPTPALTHS